MPDSADAWYGLGDAQRFDKQFELAVESYREAVRLDPSMLDAWNNLGISRAEVGDASGARSAWKAALTRSPAYCKAHNNLGMLAFRRQEWDLAVTELRSTLAYCADDVVAHFGLGNLYYGPRRSTEAAAYHYEQVLRVEPQFAHVEQVKERLLELTW